MDLCDDVWEVRLHFHDGDNLEKSMCVSDNTFLNLIALIETAGYGEGDYMYYVKNVVLGVAGLEEICDDDKIDEMLDHIASKDQTIVNLIVVRGTEPRTGDLNIGDVDLEQQELERTMELKRKNKIERFKKHKKSVERVEAIKRKLHVLLTEDDRDLELDEDFMVEMRRQREDPLLHFEGDTDVEELCEVEEEEVHEEHHVDSEEHVESEEHEEEVVPQGQNSKKLTVRKGPTSRSHASLEQVFEDVWEPSSDEDPNPSDLKEEEDDGAVPLQFVLGKTNLVVNNISEVFNKMILD
ncbi:RNA-dependent RNA polymerase 1 [Hordeum vulgare]|nr:RNA-dependent RNA polymerase 1 [Hordeum vulgare]